MKKILFRSLLAFRPFFSFPFQVVEACTGFIVGKDLTADGTTLYGRTEDLEPNTIRSFWFIRERPMRVVPSWSMKPTALNGPCQQKATSIPSVSDVTPSQGILTRLASMSNGVSISATVSAKANDAIQKVDPYVANGLAEPILTTVVLPPRSDSPSGCGADGADCQRAGSSRGEYYYHC